MSAIGGTAADEFGTVPAIGHDDRVPLAAWALAAATAPVYMAANHIGNATPYDLLAWTVVAAGAVLRELPAASRL